MKSEPSGVGKIWNVSERPTPEPSGAPNSRTWPATLPRRTVCGTNSARFNVAGLANSVSCPGGKKVPV